MPAKRKCSARTAHAACKSSGTKTFNGKPYCARHAKSARLQDEAAKRERIRRAKSK